MCGYLLLRVLYVFLVAHECSLYMQCSPSRYSSTQSFRFSVPWMKRCNFRRVGVRTQTVSSVVMCEFSQSFFHLFSLRG